MPLSKKIKPQLDKTNKMSVLPAKTQIRLGIRQSDQSLHCLQKETLGPYLPIERTAKTVIRLGECPGWSESLLGAHSFCWFCYVMAQFIVILAHRGKMYCTDVLSSFGTFVLSDWVKVQFLLFSLVKTNSLFHILPVDQRYYQIYVTTGLFMTVTNNFFKFCLSVLL